jgi:cytochrome c553
MKAAPESRLRRLGLVTKLGQLFRGVRGHPRMSVDKPSWRAMGRQSGECAIMNIKHVAAIAVLSIGASSPVLADDQKPANSQEGYAPPLNLLMVATQLSHFKLWYAGTARNWPLANYELVQIRTSIDRARSLYPNNVQSNMTMMMPVADEVENAIKAKDSVKFSKAFSKLTAACNTCHEATGFGFIKMKDPRLSPIETSPFSDESISGY